MDWSKIYRGNLTWLPERTIFVTRHGSHAYGTSTPTSDLDLRGIAVAPPRYYLGFVDRFEQAESKDPDLVVYDVRKFFALAADANPNALEFLFTDPSDHLLVTPVGARLLAARELFLSRKAKHTLSGYAVSQMKRIQTHHRWLVSPPAAPPTRAELGYNGRKREWDQYQTWRATRNPARAELEAKHGYDTKHGMHLVRLMRTCRELLMTGRYLVRRPDAEELLAIRGGAWTYDQLVDFAEREDRALTELAKTSPLPREPDRRRLDDLCAEIVRETL